MNITIDISPEIEPRLLQEAARQGIDPGQYIVNAVRARLGGGSGPAARLDTEESILLAEINQGLPEEEWSRYCALVGKRQANMISDGEREELTAMADRIEKLNNRRLEQMAELARLRGITLPELLDQLGIQPPAVI